MAKQMYEKEKIRAIAAKIKKYDPSWFNGLTTAEMPKGIERVYEIGFADGRQSGYNEGRNASVTAFNNNNYEQGYNEGYDKGYATGFRAADNLTKLPELTYPGTPEDLVAGTQLIDSRGNLIEGELEPVPMLGIMVAANPYTVDTAGGKEIWFQTTYPGRRSYIANGTNVVVTSVARNFGNAPANVVPKGYTFTSETGLKVEGTAEPRAGKDVTVNNADVTIPAGYYAESVQKTIDTDPFYDAGHDAGYESGYSKGYNHGHDIGTNTGFSNGYEHGYIVGCGDGADRVKTEEARTRADIVDNLPNLSFTVPSGYYADAVNLDTSSHWDDGYERGHAEGVNALKHEEARTEEDVTFELDIDSDFLPVTVPQGYYATEVIKNIDLTPVCDARYDAGYDMGYADGLSAGGGGGGSSEDLDALGALCDWSIMTDTSSIPIICLVNYHPTYYMCCTVYTDSGDIPYYYDENGYEVYPEFGEVVVAPNQVLDLTFDYPMSSMGGIYVENVRWTRDGTV